MRAQDFERREFGKCRYLLKEPLIESIKLKLRQVGDWDWKRQARAADFVREVLGVAKQKRRAQKKLVADQAR